MGMGPTGVRRVFMNRKQFIEVLEKSEGKIMLIKENSHCLKTKKEIDTKQLTCIFLELDSCTNAIYDASFVVNMSKSSSKDITSEDFPYIYVKVFLNEKIHWIFVHQSNVDIL